MKPGSKRDPESPAGNVVSVYLNDTEMERVNSVVGKSDKSEFIRQILMDAIEDIETEY